MEHISQEVPVSLRIPLVFQELKTNNNLYYSTEHVTFIVIFHDWMMMMMIVRP